MQVEQVDIDAAKKQFQLNATDFFDADRLASAFAHHREAARIEGIRLGLEAAAQKVAGYCRDMNRLKKGASFVDAVTAIRAIDPAVIDAGQLPQRADSGR